MGGLIGIGPTGPIFPGKRGRRTGRTATGAKLSSEIVLILVALVVLEVKHFIIDYTLQSSYQYKNKGKYGHPGGIIHAGFQALGSLPAFLVITPSLGLAAAIVVGEFIIHYHVDWAKEQLNQRLKVERGTATYWFIFGADQLLHHLSYIAIVALLAAYAF
jgi:hypothetical protein